MVFITGGVRSGKSAFAEYYAKKLYSVYNKKQLLYIASGVAIDDEMQARIERHQKDRLESDIVWQTIEVSDVLPSQLEQFTTGTVILWDCITTWLSNVLYKTENILGRNEAIQQYIVTFQQQLMSWKASNVSVIIVSNEVLDEQKSHYADVELYKKLLGELSQWLVVFCDEAYEIDHKHVNRWK
ncbi:bifunctional adenosylcobinamide kinase/adenosylcobinamide-phosphate guanylyltransferase [Solibacillus sp. CAU 1738]|uniref:bifunctional adenosylcobinamide kinase/adenosylcobinamide-phosphate guanylyltransferase n=1 Tax=Solibacillus sp. CAU 1738 TaxID=3140363 RepID=UPI00326180D2